MHQILHEALSATPNVHRGAVLPAARAVVLAVPIAAMFFYVFVVRSRRK